LKRSRALSQAEIARRIDEAYRKILEENGLSLWSPDELKDMLKTVHLSPHTTLVRGLTIGAMIGISSPGKKLAPMIKSEEQLDRVLEGLREHFDKSPTMMRKAAKDMMRALPRKGGPGRQRKLSPEEASLMCDQIGQLIREGKKLKPALEEAAKQSSRILGGKRVGARTLQNAWNDRQKFPKR
jgi:hypothetical protein